MSSVLENIFFETADLLEPYLGDYYSLYWLNPQYDAVNKLINHIRSDNNLLLSQLRRDLDKLIKSPSDPDYDCNDALPELVEKIKRMQKAKILANNNFLFDYLRADDSNPDGLNQLLDATSILSWQEQCRIFEKKDPAFGNILFFALNYPKSPPFAYGVLLEFITNQALLALAPKQSHLAKANISEKYRSFIAALLTNSPNDDFHQHNLLISTLLRRKELLSSVLDLWVLLGPKFSGVFDEHSGVKGNKEFKEQFYYTHRVYHEEFGELFSKKEYVVRNVLSYAITDAPELIPELLKAIKHLDKYQQIAIIHCAVVGFYESVGNLLSSVTKGPKYTKQALKNFFMLAPYLETSVSIDVLLHGNITFKYRRSLFVYALEEPYAFFDIMDWIERLSSPERARFLAHEHYFECLKSYMTPLEYILWPEKWLGSQSVVESTSGSDDTETLAFSKIIKLQSSLRPDEQASIYRHSVPYSKGTILMAAGSRKYQHIALLCNQFDSLPVEERHSILAQVDSRGYNMLVDSTTWSIDSFEWYMNHLLCMPREQQIAILTHPNVLLTTIVDILNDIPDEASRRLALLFRLIDQVIYLDKAQTIADIKMVMVILKQTDDYKNDIFAMAVRYRFISEYVFKLLRLVPDTKRGNLLLGLDNKNRNYLLSAVMEYNSDKEHRKNMLDYVLLLANNAKPSCIVPLFKQAIFCDLNILMLALNHNKPAFSFLLEYMSNLPKELITDLLTYHDNRGYNILMLIVKKYREAVPKLLSVIEGLDAKAQQTIFKQNCTTNRNNALLLAIHDKNGSDAASAIYRSIEKVPDLSQKIEKQTCKKRYARYFFLAIPKSLPNMSTEEPPALSTGPST